MASDTAALQLQAVSARRRKSEPGWLTRERVRYPARIRVDPRNPRFPARKENAGHQRGVVVRHLVGVSNQTKAELCVTVVFFEL
jgi:hypothetical protein